MYRIALPEGVELVREDGHALFFRMSDGALLRRIDDPLHRVVAA